MAWYDDPIIVIVIVLVVVIAASAVVFAMRRSPKKPTPKLKTQPSDPIAEFSNSPFRITKSVQTTMASSAKDELRTLDLEREILGDAIRRLYEAHAEGKITEQ